VILVRQAWRYNAFGVSLECEFQGFCGFKPSNNKPSEATGERGCIGDAELMATWQVQDAKARFSELLDATLEKGPQVVTRAALKPLSLCRSRSGTACKGLRVPASKPCCWLPKLALRA
jgi:hypothetical protein